MSHTTDTRCTHYRLVNGIRKRTVVTISLKLVLVALAAHGVPLEEFLEVFGLYEQYCLVCFYEWLGY